MGIEWKPQTFAWIMLRCYLQPTTRNNRKKYRFFSSINTHIVHSCTILFHSGTSSGTLSTVIPSPGFFLQDMRCRTYFLKFKLNLFKRLKLNYDAGSTIRASNPETNVRMWYSGHSQCLRGVPTFKHVTDEHTTLKHIKKKGGCHYPSKKQFLNVWWYISGLTVRV